MKAIDPGSRFPSNRAARIGATLLLTLTLATAGAAPVPAPSASVLAGSASAPIGAAAVPAGAASGAIAAVPGQATVLPGAGSRHFGPAVTRVFLSVDEDGRSTFSDHAQTGARTTHVRSYESASDERSLARARVERDYWRAQADAFAVRQLARDRELTIARANATRAQSERQTSSAVVPVRRYAWGVPPVHHGLTAAAAGYPATAGAYATPGAGVGVGVGAGAGVGVGVSGPGAASGAGASFIGSGFARAR